MFYLIRVKGWPVLVWLEKAPPAGRYEVVSRFDDVLMAVAGFHDAVEEARVARSPSARPSAAGVETPGWRSLQPSRAYAPVSGKTMSPSPPAAKNSAT
jgi:hypothetical protein